MGISVDFVDGSDAEAVAAALPGAKLLYLESPTSTVFELQDLERLAGLARSSDVITVIDNSWATPLFQRPLAHGVDLVLHSASKYLGGHSDTVAGVVAGSKALIDRINSETYGVLGAKLSPFEGWLLLRGLRTLPIRMKAHERSALALAERLKGHGDVLAVHHPVYSNHPGRRTLLGFSGLFSFEVSEAIDVPKFVDALKYFKLGVSWGGHESLAMPVQAAMAQTPGVNANADFGVSAATIRLSIGHEDTDDLWSDLQHAFKTARR
jgi:cystathionine beta-lyase/cystathionine gamma-synthase